MAHNAQLHCNNIICITVYIVTLRKILYDAHKNLDKKHYTKKEINYRKINYKTYESNLVKGIPLAHCLRKG